jgi:phospholipid transport system substrate-binding protein
MKGGKQLGYAGRYKLLEPVIDKTFAMAYMGKSSLGRYWKPLSEQEQKDFLALYREWSIAQYAENFDEYDEQSFKIVSESESAREIVTVNSDFTKAIGDVIEFNYKLRQFKGQWRIVDIMISGVSQLANTRSQFMDVMAKKGLTGLNAMMKEKIEMFSKKR